MKKIFYLAIIFLFGACTGRNSENVAVNIIANIPNEPPVLPGYSGLDVDKFKHRVDVKFCGDTVMLSELPHGVEAAVRGANVLLRSESEGVEYRLSGTADYASFELHCNKSPLVTLDGVKIFSRERSALVIKSDEVAFLRTIGDTISYLMDGMPGDTLLNVKKATAVMLHGDAVLCGNGKLSLRGERKIALHSAGALLLDGADVTVEMARGDGIRADSGLVVVDCNLTVNSWKDAFKSKAGNVVLLGGSMNLNGIGKKGDGVQAKNVLMFGGDMNIDVKGEAARGLNSKGAVYILGGALNVNSAGNAIYSAKKNDYTSGACIKSETDFYMGAGHVSLCSGGIGGKGINCNGLMQIDGGSLSVEVFGSDAVHPSERNAHSSAKGIKCDSVMLLQGGNINVAVHGKGERCEGIEAKYDMTITGDATVYVYAYDDALNAGGRLSIAGGRVYGYSVANDAIDGNAVIDVSGGLVVANGSNMPEQGFDTDMESDFVVTGGEIISIGGTMEPSACMPRNKNTSQCVVAWNGVDLHRGTFVNISDAVGTVIYSYRLPRTLQGGAFMLSSSMLRSGGKYSLCISDTLVARNHLGNGLYYGGTVRSDATMWVQSSLLMSIDGNGVVMPVESFDNGSVNKGGMIPPPPPRAGDKRPSFPKFDGQKPPMPREGLLPQDFDNEGMPPPPPPAFHFTDEGYGADNLPGGGW